ncbi:MAG: hypothetical protein ACP5PT_08785 [Brevinematia bacterium]
MEVLDFLVYEYTDSTNIFSISVDKGFISIGIKLFSMSFLTISSILYSSFSKNFIEFPDMDNSST